MTRRPFPRRRPGWHEPGTAGLGEAGDLRGCGEPLLAYLHLRRDAGPHTRAVLEGHIRAFADREGFDLAGLLVATEEPRQPARAGRASPGEDDAAGHAGKEGRERDGHLSLRDLVEQLELTCARKVLVVGPARQALVLLHRMKGIQVLTLAQVRPAQVTPADDAERADPDRRRGHGVGR